MTPSPKPSVLLGALAASLPLMSAPLGSLLFVILVGGAAGFQELWVATAPGAYFISGVGAVSTVALAGCLFLVGIRRAVPLALFFGLAALPWLVGAVSAQHGLGLMGDALHEAQVNSNDALRIASVGTGEALGARTLGAWTSAVLLGATALGLALASLGARRQPAPVPTAPGAFTLVAAAALALAFSLLGVFAALFSRNLSEALQASGQLNPTDMLTVMLAVAVDRLLLLQRATTGALAAMVLLFVPLSFSRLAHSKRQGAIPGLVVLAVILVLVPVVDGLPLRDAVQIVRSLRPQAEGPWAGVEPLTLPDSITPQKPMGAVTAEGFVSAGGTRTPWSAGEEALARALEATQTGDTDAGPQPNKFLQALAKKKGTRTFALIVDARLDGAQVRTLVEASLRAKASRLQLIGQGPASPSPEAERVLDSAHPLLALVLRHGGAVNVELSRGVAEPQEASAAPGETYTARFENTEALHISRLEEPGTVRRIPLSSAPTSAPEGIGGEARIYFPLDEHTSVRAIAAAARTLGLSDATLVLSTEEAPARLEVVEDGTP